MNILSKYVNFAYSCPLLLSESGRIKGFAELTVPSEPFGVKSILSERSSQSKGTDLTYLRKKARTMSEERREENCSLAAASLLLVVIAVGGNSFERRDDLVSSALFFMGFFSIYIRRCSQSSTGGSVRATLSLRSRRAAAARGLDASVIETFPTLAYSEVKDLKIGKGALECAVCLNEFEDDETLRLLPKCDHVFHPECIDLWLASHVTCPVCRADLVPKTGESADLPDGLSNPESEASESNNNIIEELPQGEFHVTIIPDEDQVLDSNSNNLQEPPRSGIMKRNGSLRSNRPPRSGSVRSKLFGNKFSRSHSTGHSLVQLGETYDRYTLRLPAEVRKEVIKKALLNPTGSCATAGLACEQSGRKGYRTGNATGESSSRGRSYRRLGSLERVAKSDRWVFSRMPSFLTRALSVRSPKVVADGEASTSAKAGGSSSVKIDEAGLVANDSAKLPV